jgi:hypothetical protein
MNRDIDVDARSLASLTTLQPDPARAAVTRERCRALLAERAASAGSPKRPAHRPFPSMTGTALRNAMIAACGILCVVYVVALAITTAGLRRLL